MFACLFCVEVKHRI